MGWGNHHKNQKENYRMPSYWFIIIIIIIILFCVIHFIQSSWKVGEGMRSDHLTWRHTCVVLDFEEGLHAFFYKYCLHIVILLSYKFAPQWHLYMLSLYYCHDAFPCPGRVAMWENGKKYFEKTDIADLPATYKRNRKEIDIVSAGLVGRIRIMLLIIRSMFFMQWPSNVHIYIGARIRQGQHPWCQSMARYNNINQ